MSNIWTHYTARTLHVSIALVLLRRLKYSEVPLAVFPNCQDAGKIAAPVAIVWRRPDRNKLLIEHVFETFLHKLMCTCD